MYQNASTSRILEPSQQSLIYSVIYVKSFGHSRKQSFHFRKKGSFLKLQHCLELGCQMSNLLLESPNFWVLILNTAQTYIRCIYIYISTTPLRQWGFRQCLPFSWTTLRDKHCRHPIAVLGVVDTFGHCLSLFSFCVFPCSYSRVLNKRGFFLKCWVWESLRIPNGTVHDFP